MTSNWLRDWEPIPGETCWYKDRPAYAPASDIPVVVVDRSLLRGLDWVVRLLNNDTRFSVFTSQLRPMTPLEALGAEGA